MCFATCSRMALGEVKAESAMMPRSPPGRGSPAAIRAEAAPMDMPKRYRGMWGKRSARKASQSAQSSRSRRPKAM